MSDITDIMASFGGYQAIGSGPQAAIDALMASRGGRQRIIAALVTTTAQAAPSPMALIGQVAADMTASDSGIYLSTPSLLQPADASDWFFAIEATPGQVNGSTASAEVLSASGASFSLINGTHRVIALTSRTSSISIGVWRWLMMFFAGNRDLLANLTPALSTQPLAPFSPTLNVVGVRNFIPMVSIQVVGAAAPHFQAVGNDIRAFDNFYFPAATYTDGTVSRTGNSVVFQRTNLSISTFPVGKSVLVQSSEHPEINGIGVVSAVVLGQATITLPNGTAGSNFTVTGANASIAPMRTPTTLVQALGGFSSLSGVSRFSWSGGIQRIELRYGSLPVTLGQIDQTWLRQYANRQIPDNQLPGTKQYACTTSPDTGYAADADGAVTTAITANGTVRKQPQIGVDWLIIDKQDAHTPFASDFNPANGTGAGTVAKGFWASQALSGLFATVEKEDGTVVLSERQISSGAAAGGRGTISLSGVPNGVGLYLNIRPPSGTPRLRWGPFNVGPQMPHVSQSTLDVLFTSYTGTSITPVAETVGVGTVGNVAGGLTSGGTTPTDQANFCRLAEVRLAAPGSCGDGMMAYSNVGVAMLSAATGVASALATTDLCRSGHPADYIWLDRFTFVNGIGAAAAGVTKTGTWVAHPMMVGGAVSTVNFSERGTVMIYRGGTWAQTNPSDITDPYLLTGGTLIATVASDNTIVAAGGSGVTGSFNHDSGVYSINDPVGGQIYIQARMQMDTLSSTTSSGTRQTTDGFTAMGIWSEAESGHISNLLKAMPRQTMVVYSWANYLLSYANSVAQTQAQVDAKVAFDIAMIRRRFEDYPAMAGLPWLIIADPRTTAGGSQYGEHRIRLALRKYGVGNPNTYWGIGPITGEMNGTASAHPGSQQGSAPLWGATLWHAQAKVLGVSGAKADEVFITGALRSADATSTDLTFNTPVGAGLTCGDPTKIEGLFTNTVDDTFGMTAIDVVGGAYTTSIIAPNKVRVTKASGTFPSGLFWALNVGNVLTDTTLAAESARLLNTLSLNTGGNFPGRPGQPTSFNPYNVLAGQA